MDSQQVRGWGLCRGDPDQRRVVHLAMARSRRPPPYVWVVLVGLLVHGAWSAPASHEVKALPGWNHPLPSQVHT